MDDARIAEERHFYALYTRVLDYVKEKESLRDRDVTEGVDAVETAFKFHMGHRFSDIDFSRPRNVCGYLFRGGGAVAAGVTRYRILQAARNCRALEDTCLRGGGQRGLRVVSVRGGPAADALGFCSALVEMGFSRGRALDITVVDPVARWKECVDHAEDLLRRGDFGRASLLFRRNPVTVNYVEEDVPLCEVHGDYETRDGIHAMVNADIILVQKVLSNLELYDVPEVVEDIHKWMEEDALLIVINTTLKERDGKLVYGKQEFDCFRGFDLLYLSGEDGGYSLLETHRRFGKNDGVSTKVRIAVLRKTPTPADGLQK